MCGIAGIVSFSGEPVDPNSLSEMLSRLAHRGKDHSGMAIGSAYPQKNRTISRKAEVALGHRRLSIIDLSDTASQPMAYDNDNLWITFNGEIYNYLELREELKGYGYQFRTNSDTEVILAAYKKWGRNCVQRFNGMFAFALWDEGAQQLFCARDHLGIKPFYFFRAPTFLAFASESKALREFHGNALDPDGLASYLLGLYVPAAWSIFQGVSKLLPGHTMTIQPGGSVAQERYWRLGALGDLPDDLPLRHRLEESLKSAVKMQLRSDVPVGALLSGGVDSGMVVALASKVNPDIHTYSVGFEGQAVNELKAAADVSRKFGTQHHETLVSDKEAIRLLDSSIQYMSEPIADPAIIPSYVLSKMAASDGVKVLLSGTGGDEIFGGYDRYVGVNWKRRLLSQAPERMRMLASSLLPTASKLGSRLSNIYLDMLFTTAGSFDLCASALGGGREMESFLKRLANAFPITAGHGEPLLYKQMGFDMNVYLPDEILLLFDQMSMANTIEGRVPLLDINVVEIASRFPPSSHVNAGRTKILFREIAESYLGHKHVWQKKQGFSGPVPWWVNRNLPLFMQAARSTVTIPGLQMLDTSRFCDPGGRGEVGDSAAHALFILYCLRRWHDQISADT
jgi:asparagine synthase (glutamine-hydrolysing)